MYYNLLVTIKKENSVHFLLINVESSYMPVIDMAATISQDLRTKIFYKQVSIEQTEKFITILGKEKKCDTWSKFRSLLHCIFNHEKVSCVNDNFNEKLQSVKCILKELHCCDQNVDPAVCKKLRFLEEQVGLLICKQPKYTTETLIWACTLNFTHPSAYVSLRNSEVLTMPHRKYLNTFKMKLGAGGTGINISQVRFNIYTFLHFYL